MDQNEFCFCNRGNKASTSAEAQVVWTEIQWAGFLFNILRTGMK